MQISIERAVISGIVSHALAYEKEVSGLLLGPSLTDGKVLVSDFVVYRVVGSEAQVEIPPDFLAKVKEALEGKKKYILGWYHSHPQRNAFISRRDAETQNRLQQFNSNFVSLNVAFKEENGEKSKTIIEMICYRLGSGGKAEFLPIRITDRYASEVALGEIKADIEKARAMLEELKGRLDSNELRTELIQPLLKYNIIIEKIVLMMAKEVEILQRVKLLDIEKKNEEIGRENENLKQELQETNETVNYLNEKKEQIERIERELRNDLQSTKNDNILRKGEIRDLNNENRRVKKENEELLRRVSKLLSDNSELEKKIKELKERKYGIPVLMEKEKYESPEISERISEDYSSKK
ncbi:MAG: Mov34/MPN/PAD-1 family protein [Theionarchaea archaeon]|nr:Mov34/MPN/PAD-1 family protein [Theionarchaea archaeon]